MVFARFYLIFLILNFTCSTDAAPLCKNLFIQTKETLDIALADPYLQWLKWEQTENHSNLRRSFSSFQLNSGIVTKESVELFFDETATPELKKYLTPSNYVRWFKHPLNRSREVPHHDLPTLIGVAADFTASRSVAVEIANMYHSIKMGVSHPNGLTVGFQKGKDKTAEDIRDGLSRMKHIAQVERSVGVDPELRLIREVAIIRDKISQQGYLVRDLSFLNSGNYYLPAFSIPYVGHEIAKHNGQEFVPFWQKHYAELLGRAKAKLLLRYGLQMETPNAQNMLIELDANLAPTGRIFFRDLSDTALVSGAAQGIGAIDILVQDLFDGVQNTSKIKTLWNISSWMFDERLSRPLLNQWGIAHDQAYKAELEKCLKIDLKEFPTRGPKEEYLPLDSNTSLEPIMNSTYIVNRFSEYRKELEKKAGHRRQPSEASRP